MRVAVCQMRSGADVGANLAEAERLLGEAADAGAELASLPEFFSYLGPDSRIPRSPRPCPGAPRRDVGRGGTGASDVGRGREHQGTGR